MKASFDSKANYEQSKKAIGYVSRKEATPDDYQRIGFMSGLEVHQQLLTQKKLFCNCPAGIYHDHNDYDAEIIRHMRPTLSELGEYDGTALMEFKTRKEITYRINNETACTYEVDDTPPFPINRQALEIAIEISLLSKLNIVGEVHITRKQYLDGSIPTGFQRTAIIGVEGEIQLKNKKVKLIQLSIEEDSCREISDIGHKRLYKTDRLGMPLIETVTYPELFTPDELMEAAQYIRFLNRSTGKVRIGIGAGREDVNVSCKGGTRVEIKGVAHNKWIPELSHNEAFRQWALLHIRDILQNRIPNPTEWNLQAMELDYDVFEQLSFSLKAARDTHHKLMLVNLPEFKGILSHFTQPEKSFAHELSDRLQVIACLIAPFMIHTEQFEYELPVPDFDLFSNLISAGENDAQIIFWAPADDVQTAIETIEERCKMALEGVPNETRKSFENGTTMFERVLPGADRMYPDTDSAPIPVEEEYIQQLAQNLPKDIWERYQQMRNWEVPEDAMDYILRNNLVPLIEKIAQNIPLEPKWLATLFAHDLKNIEGKSKRHPDFDYELVEKLLLFLHGKEIEPEIVKWMLPILYQYPNMDFESVLITLKYKKRSKDELLAPIEFLYEKFKEISHNPSHENAINWLMGQIHRQALGNYKLSDLRNEIKSIVNQLA